MGTLKEYVKVKTHSLGKRFCSMLSRKSKLNTNVRSQRMAMLPISISKWMLASRLNYLCLLCTLPPTLKTSAALGLLP